MSDVFYQPQDLIDPDVIPATETSPLRLIIRPQADRVPVNPLAPLVVADAGRRPAQVEPPSNVLAQRGIIDKLLGLTGPRYQTWPEKMTRSGVALPHDVMAGPVAVTDPYGRVVESAPAFDLRTGHTSDPLTQRVMDLSGLIMGGGIPAAARGALGAAGGKIIQPEITPGPFYSAVEHALTNAPQERMTPQQWTGWLKNQPGVKAEELSWLGLDDPASLPAGPKGQVDKAALLEHAQGHGPQIKEVEKGGSAYDEGAAHEIAYKKADEEAQAQGIDDEEWVQSRAYDIFDEMPIAEGGTKFSEYQLPGGDNYRELLLTMPFKKAESGKAIADEVPEWQRQYMRPEAWAEDPNNVYRSSHWDEPNVIVHMRMNDRDVPSIGKSLHLEEVQSDWHQQGRKQGYKSNDLKKDFKERFGREPSANELKEFSEEWVNQGGTVPDAPFKSTWADLALKRAIAKAAREGYDAISWTPGEQQAARYDLSKQVDKIKYNPDANKLEVYKDGALVLGRVAGRANLPDFIGKEAADRILNNPTRKNEKTGFNELEGEGLKVGGEGMKRFYDKMLVDKANALAKKFGGKVEWKDLPSSTGHEVVSQPHGELTIGEPQLASTVPASRRDAMVGVYENGVFKDNYEKSAGLVERLSKTMVSGPDGIRYFDTPQEAQAFIDSKRVKVPVLRLTPEMKNTAVRKGMPLFSSGLSFQFIPVDHDPFKLDPQFEQAYSQGSAT
jgi:hypothetical protein